MNRAQLAGAIDPLTMEDESHFLYAMTLAHPFNPDPSGNPINPKNTTKAQVVRTFTIEANASGFAFLGVKMDGWIGSGDSSGVDPTGFLYHSYQGGTQGSDIAYSTASFSGVTTPAAATSAATGLVFVATEAVDSSWDSTTNVRLVSCGLRVYSEAAADTASGHVRLVATTEPYAVAADGSLQYTTEAAISKFNPEVIAQAVATLPNWAPGKKFEAVSVPDTFEADLFHSLPGTAASVFGYPSLMVIMSGAATNQKLTVEVVKNWEYQVQQSNRVVDPSTLMMAGDPRVTGPIKQFIKMNPVSSPTPVKPSSVTHNLGAAAFVDGLAKTRPLKLTSIAQLAAKKPAGLSSLIKSALPYLGGLAAKYLPSPLAKVAGGIASAIPFAMNAFGL
jgi:hypothetical protein